MAEVSPEWAEGDDPLDLKFIYRRMSVLPPYPTKIPKPEESIVQWQQFQRLRFEFKERGIPTDGKYQPKPLNIAQRALQGGDDSGTRMKRGMSVMGLHDMKPTTVVDTLTSARQNLDDGIFPKALSLYTDVVCETICERALCLMQMEKFEDVIVSCDAVLIFEPKHGKALIRKAKALGLLQRIEEAKAARALALPTLQESDPELWEVNAICDGGVKAPPPRAAANGQVLGPKLNLPSVDKNFDVVKSTLRGKDSHSAQTAEKKPAGSNRPADALDLSLVYATMVDDDLPDLPSNPPSIDSDMLRWQQYQRLKMEYRDRKLQPRFSVWKP